MSSDRKWNLVLGAALVAWILFAAFLLVGPAHASTRDVFAVRVQTTVTLHNIQSDVRVLQCAKAAAHPHGRFVRSLIGLADAQPGISRREARKGVRQALYVVCN